MSFSKKARGIIVYLLLTALTMNLVVFAAETPPAPVTNVFIAVPTSGGNANTQIYSTATVQNINFNINLTTTVITEKLSLLLDTNIESLLATDFTITGITVDGSAINTTTTQGLKIDETDATRAILTLAGTLPIGSYVIAVNLTKDLATQVTDGTTKKFSIQVAEVKSTGVGTAGQEGQEAVEGIVPSYDGTLKAGFTNNYNEATVSNGNLVSSGFAILNDSNKDLKYNELSATSYFSIDETAFATRYPGYRPDEKVADWTGLQPILETKPGNVVQKVMYISPGGTPDTWNINDSHNISYNRISDYTADNGHTIGQYSITITVNSTVNKVIKAGGRLTLFYYIKTISAWAGATGKPSYTFNNCDFVFPNKELDSFINRSTIAGMSDADKMTLSDNIYAAPYSKVKLTYPTELLYDDGNYPPGLKPGDRFDIVAAIPPIPAVAGKETSLAPTSPPLTVDIDLTNLSNITMPTIKRTTVAVPLPIDQDILTNFVVTSINIQILDSAGKPVFIAYAPTNLESTSLELATQGLEIVKATGTTQTITLSNTVSFQDPESGVETNRLPNLTGLTYGDLRCLIFTGMDDNPTFTINVTYNKAEQVFVGPIMRFVETQIAKTQNLGLTTIAPRVLE